MKLFHGRLSALYLKLRLRREFPEVVESDIRWHKGRYEVAIVKINMERADGRDFDVDTFQDLVEELQPGPARIDDDCSLPTNAEFLFYLFLDAKECEVIVGDLEERYRLIHKKFGARRANFWYWTQAICSVAPIAWQWVTKLVMRPILRLSKWAIAVGLLEKGATSEFVKALLAQAMKKIRG